MHATRPRACDGSVNAGGKTGLISRSAFGQSGQSRPADPSTSFEDLGRGGAQIYFDSLKRQALATSLAPSNVPLQLMYQPSFNWSSELGLASACLPYIHFVSAL